MVASPSPSVEERLSAMELQLKELRRRLALVEQAVAARPEHGVDNTLTRQKVRYDWQD